MIDSMSDKTVQKVMQSRSSTNLRDIEIIFDRSFVMSASPEKIVVSGIGKLLRESESDEYRATMGLNGLGETSAILMRDCSGWYKIPQDRPMVIERVTRADAEGLPWHSRLFVSNLINHNENIDTAILMVMHNRGLHIYQED